LNKGRAAFPLAVVVVAAAFLALNYRAYDGFFQDDELDTLSWAPSRPIAEFASAFLKPAFDRDNFRPVGHLYYMIMGREFGLDFPPYITPLFGIHLLNGALIFLLCRRLAVGCWHALAGAALFLLSSLYLDAYWKPMYVFDLLCGAFCLASVLLYSYRRWVLAFLSFWCAYKAKELAVMLPMVLLAWEFWLGNPRRWIFLAPFFLASLSFGLQGILLNPNHDNEYTFRFTWEALQVTTPFYLGPAALLLLLALVRDRRVWFGLSAWAVMLTVLLFLPGRLFPAYRYVPSMFATLAITAAASHLRLVWIWTALALWLSIDLPDIRNQHHQILARDDEAAAFVQQLESWSRRHPSVRTLVYSGLPTGYHHWGVTGAWNIAHHTAGLPALYVDWPEAGRAMASGPVAFAAWTWNGRTGALLIRIRG
jgi:hypothetical protein